MSYKPNRRMCRYGVNKPQTMQIMVAPSFILCSAILTLVLLQSAHSDPQVPCYFVFGDSLSDNGNNNHLSTLAKVNYSPYGTDYPGHQATGRFSNGRNIVDVISGHLGFEDSAPPFASTATIDEEVLLKGVNYASGSAGIRQETGKHLGVRIPLDEQLINHETVVSRISGLIGNDPSYLRRCLYTINIGSNDYLNNYYVPDKYSSSQLYNWEQYAEVLVHQYSQQIQRLYGMGARKVAVFAVGELGLTPQGIAKYGTLGANKLTVASSLFNKQLRKLVDELNSNLTDANFTCINMDFISPTSSIGFLHLTAPCCEVRSDGQCKDDSIPCANRNRYVFFDNFHPTEAINSHIGGRAYKAAFPFDVHPIDIRTLVQSLDLPI